MAAPKSLVQTMRQGQLSVGNGWRLYFAPFNKTAAVASQFINVGTSLIDLNNDGPFTEAILLGRNYRDLGFSKDTKVSAGTKFTSIKSGHRNVTRAMYVGDVAETLDVTFMEQTRIVNMISSGMQVFNLLSNPTFNGALTGPLSASGTTAVAMGASGYLAAGVPTTATAGKPTLTVPAGSGAAFTVGQYIVCDVDFVPGSGGYLGDSAALAFPGTVTDVDFIRKTSDYCARIIGIVPTVVAGMDALVLDQPFAGGGNNLVVANVRYSPSVGAKVQVMKGYARRNGGSKINEWSCVAVLDTEDASQFVLYYPRLVSMTPKGMVGANMTDATGLSQFGMSTEFEALAYDDPLDGETVVSYLAYYPNAGQNIAI